MAVQTVLGPVAAGKLGVTLTHEHLSLDFSSFFRTPPHFFRDKLQGDFSLKNVAYLRQYPYSSRQNLRLSGPEVETAVLRDCQLFVEAGGGSLVENTSWGLGRDLGLMERVALGAPANVIAGTGHYVEEVQPAGTLSQGVEELASLYRQELQVGCLDRPEVRCGFIGEVGSTWPITGFERRCIEATAVVQSELRCPVSFHPGRNESAPAEILRLYSEAGGDTRKAVMSHLDRTFPSLEETLEFSGLGSYLQFDLFGTEVSFYQLCPERDMISDGERVRRLKGLLAEGKGQRLLVSHDIHTRHRLVEFGGHGFAHIPAQVRHHMLVKGIPQEDIDNILVHNPAAWLTERGQTAGR